jgi:hypothetical protein
VAQNMLGGAKGRHAVTVPMTVKVGGSPDRKAMDNLAARYRIIAAEVRAKADVLSDEQTRQGMLMAAEVWDRLATLAEVSAAASASRPSPGRHVKSRPALRS